MLFGDEGIMTYLQILSHGLPTTLPIVKQNNGEIKGETRVANGVAAPYDRCCLREKTPHHYFFAQQTPRHKLESTITLPSGVHTHPTGEVTIRVFLPPLRGIQSTRAVLHVFQCVVTV